MKDSDLHLSDRQVEVVRCCCEGMIDKEIAAKLGISIRTVSTHKAQIFKKLGVNNTVELVLLAKNMGII